MAFNPLHTDAELLRQIGGALERLRLNRNLTQGDLARMAGVSKSTVERLEAGGSSQLTNLLRILRALDLIEGLSLLLPETSAGPIEQVKRRGRQRQRATSPGRRGAAAAPATWRWGDER